MCDGCQKGMKLEQGIHWNEGNIVMYCTADRYKEQAEKKCSTHPECSHNTNGRDMSKPCSIAFPSPQSDWRERFEEMFCELPLYGDAGEKDKKRKQVYLSLVKFIESVEQEAEARGQEQVRSLPMGASQWKNHGIKYTYWNYFETQINKDRKDEVQSSLQSVLKSLPKEFRIKSPHEDERDYMNKKKGFEYALSEVSKIITSKLKE